jgi:PKD repeat protein
MSRLISWLCLALLTAVLAYLVGCGGAGSDTVPLPSGNTSPTAAFTVTPTSGSSATLFTVDATGSSDAEDPAGALQVRWDWESNGTWTAYSATRVATHTFATTGIHTITLQVKDTNGATATATHTVTVSNSGNAAPVASFTVTPSTGTTSTSFSVDASGSTDAQDATDALQVRWDWESNGTWTTYTTTKTATHTFTTTGSHLITLQVKDSGGMTATTSRTVTVSATNTAPTASFTVTPSSGTLATSFSVDASASSDAQDAASALQVCWDWDNTGSWSTYTTTKTATHTYTTTGTHTIALQVKDTGGLTATTTRTVTVTTASGPTLSLALDSSLNDTGATTKATAITKAELLNSAGSVVGTATVTGGVAKFDLTGLSAVTYFIRVNDLADDLVPVKLDSTSVNASIYVGSGLNQASIGTLASPTYRIATFAKGQGNKGVVKYTSGAVTSPARYGYFILATAAQTIEARVLGTGALLSSQTAGGSHSFSSWMLGSSNHGTKGSNCGCHGSLTSHPASYASVGESSGWCYKCHYGNTGTGAGLVDPAQ